MATLYYAEHLHIAQTQIWIPIPNFCVGQESEPKSVSKPIFGNVNELDYSVSESDVDTCISLVHVLFQLSGVKTLQKPY